MSTCIVLLSLDGHRCLYRGGLMVYSVIGGLVSGSF